MTKTMPIPELTQSEVDRFWSHVDKTESCWVWVAVKFADGYGHTKIRGDSRRAHRVAFTIANGGIPEGMVLDHLCRNRACVNPEHLEPVTNLENIKRGIQSGVGPGRIAATVCKNGHPFSPENSMPVKNGKRCLICHREYHKAYQAARRARLQVA